MKQKQLIIGIVVTVALVNVGGFLAFRKKQQQQPAQPQPVATAPVAAAVDQEAIERQQNARARRAAGVAALEAGDYEKALINFTEAQALIGEAAKVTELLKITEDLRNRAKEKKDEDEKAAVPETKVAAAPVRPTPGRPTPARPTPAPAPVARSDDKRPEPKPTEAPAPIVTGNGMLLVSTTPRGLLVQVDGVPMDLTPMRAPAKVGSHRVALLDGDRKVYETTVEVTEGNVSTVLKDLSVELAPKVASVETRTETRPEPTPAPIARAPEPVKKIEPAPAPAPAPAPVAPAPTPAPAPAASSGGLQITSPGLYGEIWVNGRPYGFTPVTVNGLAAGNAKVEVKVNGVVKRSSTFAVEAGQVKAIRIVK